VPTKPRGPTGKKKRRYKTTPPPLRTRKNPMGEGRWNQRQVGVDPPSYANTKGSAKKHERTGTARKPYREGKKKGGNAAINNK